MSEKQSCENCRHMHDHRRGYWYDWGGIGGDCNPPCNGKTDFTWWKEFKRCDLAKCARCIYKDDPCHYECYNCQDNLNWTPEPTLVELIDREILKKGNEIIKLRALKRKASE